jgi:hypothetical protein
MGQIGFRELLILGIILIVIPLVIRAFWLWYWKVNEIVTLLKDIRERLDKIVSK